jgi:hypothetical protein
MKERVVDLAHAVWNGENISLKNLELKVDLCATFPEDICLGYLFKGMVELTDEVPVQYCKSIHFELSWNEDYLIFSHHQGLSCRELRPFDLILFPERN